MNISAITPSMVWASSARSLTNFGSSALTLATTAFTALAASTTVDLRPSAGVFAMTTAAALTGGTSTVAMVVNMFDGTNSINLAVSAVGNNKPVGFSAFSCNPVGVSVFNGDPSISAHYMTSSLLWSQ